MRYLPRTPFPSRVLAALKSYQVALDDAVGAERDKSTPTLAERIEAAWKGRRSSKALKAVEHGATRDGFGYRALHVL
jgi:hypothetical protein